MQNSTPATKNIDRQNLSLDDTTLSNRISYLQENIDSKHLVVISRADDIYYYTGFTTLLFNNLEALLFVSKDEAILLTTSFSPAPESKDFLRVIPDFSQFSINKTFESLLASKNSDQVLIDENHLPLYFYKIFQACANRYQCKLSPLKRDYIDLQRNTKDKKEIEHVAHACRETAKIMAQIPQWLHENLSEIELKNRIDAQMRLVNGQNAFPSIVGFGANTALPHHQPTSEKLKKNTAVLIDIGIKINEYCADMTRTWWYGDTPDLEFINIEKSAITAYQKAIDHLKNTPLSQVRASDIDQACRSSIRDDGYADKFIHTSGHGLGIFIHETPSLSSTNSQPLQESMIITIEPGIYLKNSFGFRFENTILLRDLNPQILTSE